MKKLLVVFLVLVVCVSANASIVNTDFETSEGYPAAYGDSGSNLLEKNGWHCNTLGEWHVPYIANSTFGYMSQRSAKSTAAKTMGQHWATYDASWTPSTGDSTVVYSAAMAFQEHAPNYTRVEAYGGIALYGMKADNTEAFIGGIKLNVGGNATLWNGSSSIGGTYDYALNNWNRLQMQADFANDTVKCYVDGDLKGTLTFGSDIVSLSSIALFNGSTSSWAIVEVRYDAISVNVPEPMTLVMLGLGSLVLLKRNKK